MAFGDPGDARGDRRFSGVSRLEVGPLAAVDPLFEKIPDLLTSMFKLTMLNAICIHMLCW